MENHSDMKSSKLKESPQLTEDLRRELVLLKVLPKPRIICEDENRLEDTVPNFFKDMFRKESFREKAVSASLMAICLYITILTGRFGDAKPVNDKKTLLQTAKKTTKTKPDYYHIFKHLKDPAEKLKTLAGKTHEKYVNKSGLLPQLPEKGVYQKCRNDLHTRWSKLNLPNRVIAAMRHFQALVGVTQELQMSESILNKGGESEEVRKFRKIEYGLRVFVEDDLREAVESIVESIVDGTLRTSLQDKIPGYSVGGLPSPIKEIEKSAKNPNVRSENGKLLYQVEKCLEIFINHDIKHNTE